MPRRLKVPASEHSVCPNLHLGQVARLVSVDRPSSPHSKLWWEPPRSVLSNWLSSGLSAHSEVLSRYSSLGVARLFLSIASASWECRCARRSIAVLRSSIFFWMAASWALPLCTGAPRSVVSSLFTRTKSLSVAKPSAGVKISSMISSHLLVSGNDSIMVVMSFSMVTKSSDKVTSSIKPLLADDWSLSRSGLTVIVIIIKLHWHHTRCYKTEGPQILNRQNCSQTIAASASVCASLRVWFLTP